MASDQREAGAEHADQGVRIAARSDRPEITRREEAAERGANDTDFAVLVAEVPPDEKRYRQKQHHVQQVVAKAISENRHRQQRERAEILGDIGGRGIAAEEPPVPSDDDT